MYDPCALKTALSLHRLEISRKTWQPGPYLPPLCVFPSSKDDVLDPSERSLSKVATVRTYTVLRAKERKAGDGGPPSRLSHWRRSQTPHGAHVERCSSVAKPDGNECLYVRRRH